MNQTDHPEDRDDRTDADAEGGALAAAMVTAVFLIIDLAFFGANMFKIGEGGWFPLVVPAVIWLLMSTWARGRALIRQRMREETAPAEPLLKRLASAELPRVPGTAVFLTHESKAVPPILRHHLEHNRALHETVLLVTLRTSNVPRVPFRDRFDAEEVGQGIYRVIAHYGFMQGPNVPVLMESCRQADMPVSEKEETTYYVGRQTPIAVSGLGMSRWRARLFTFLSRNSPRAEATFGIPPHQVVELGIQLEV